MRENGFWLKSKRSPDAYGKKSRIISPPVSDMKTAYCEIEREQLRHSDVALKSTIEAKLTEEETARVCHEAFKQHITATRRR